MKKIFFSLFFICLLTIPVLADYSVDSVAVTAEVSGNGQAQVSATYQLSFDTTTGQIAIPLPETQVSKVSVSDFRFSMEETDQGTDVIIKRRDGFLGTVTFLVRYTVPYRDDGDEEADAFSLGLLSSRWAKDVGSCSFQVLMPAAFDAEPEIVSGYHSLLTQSEAGLTVTETSFGGSVSSLISEFRIPIDGYWKYDTVNGSSVTVMKDQQYTVESLHEFIYGRYYPSSAKAE